MTEPNFNKNNHLRDSAPKSLFILDLGAPKLFSLFFTFFKKVLL